MAETKYIIFTLGENKYGTKLEKIKGIEKDYNIVPIPVGAENIKGMIHLREEVIPIYDIKKKFNIYDETAGAEKQLLVAETHDIKIGIEVDEIVGIYALSDEEVKKVPNVIVGDETKYIENIINVDFALPGQEKQTEIMISVSIDNIMSDEDFDSVSDALNDM